GAVDVNSERGVGTTWRLTIPLTLAIIQALTVECAQERYVIPQVAVHELVFIDGKTTKIEYASGAPVYRLRGKLLPLVRLDRALGAAGSAQRVLVTGIGDRRVAIPLDTVTRLEEFERSRIEHAGSRQVVQYRDEILPLVRLADLLGAIPDESGDTVPVVVYS